MKFSFEGTLSEFRALFGQGTYAYTIDGTETFSETRVDPEVPVFEEATEVKESPPSLSPVQEMLARLPVLSPEKRRASFEAFCDFCAKWAQGFEKDEPQPPRHRMMEALGSSQHTVPVLVMAYECLALQTLVEKALIASDDDWPTRFANRDAWLDYVDRVAATMVQVSHVGFAELAGTYDYTTRWRRTT